MPKDDKLRFEGFLVHKDLDTQVREFGESRKREMAAAYARMEDPNMAAAQQAAYEAALPDLLALPAGEVRWPSHDPRLALNEALDYAEEVGERRGELQARVGQRLQVSLMLALERYTLATMHAFKAHRAQPPPPDSLAKLARDGADRRYGLGTGCDYAFRKNPECSVMLQHIDGSTVPEAIAHDIFLLRRTLLNSDPDTEGAWVANHSEMATAEQLASALLQAANNPGLRAALVWPPADMYARAYTLMDRAFNEAELGFVELDNALRPKNPRPPHCIFCDREPTMLRVHKCWM